MPQAIGVNLVIAERSGKTAQTGMWIPSATSLANALDAAQAWSILVNDLIEGAIQSASIVLPVDLSGLGLRATPLDGSSLSEGILFAYRTASNFKTSFRVPTVNEGLFLADRSVDLANADIIALNTAMVDGISLVPAGGAGTVAPTNISDETITATRVVTESYKRTNR